jgi:hypothetical protein
VGTATAVRLVLCLLLAAPGAASARGYAGIEAGVSRGDFGGPTRETLYAVTARLGRWTPDYGIEVALPYLELAREGPGIDRRDGGMGDVVVRGERRLRDGKGDSASVYGSLALKLPTADADRGLGTGEADVGAFVTVVRPIAGLKLIAHVGYVVNGDSGTQDYRDVPYYGIGLSSLGAHGAVYTALSGRGASVNGADDPLELSAGGWRRLGGDRAFTVTGFVGLNDGGPDFGATVGVVQWF